jgi:hypothetical protein
VTSFCLWRSFGRPRFSGEREKSGLFIGQEATDLGATVAEQADYVVRRAIPQSDPDHFSGY